MGAFNDRIKEGHVPVSEHNKSATTTIAYYKAIVRGNKAELTSLQVYNRSGSTTIRVSIDGGTTNFGVVPLQAPYETVLQSIHELQIDTASGTASYDLNYTYRP